ncbi:hypothetical protein Rs2_50482 [Raphanus sativus]|nr:hypothetical protein Rs2_50482 [Raphanus sativus]
MVLIRVTELNGMDYRPVLFMIADAASASQIYSSIEKIYGGRTNELPLRSPFYRVAGVFHLTDRTVTKRTRAPVQPQLSGANSAKSVSTWDKRSASLSSHTHAAHRITPAANAVDISVSLPSSTALSPSRPATSSTTLSSASCQPPPDDISPPLTPSRGSYPNPTRERIGLRFALLRVRLRS